MSIFSKILQKVNTENKTGKTEHKNLFSNKEKATNKSNSKLYYNSFKKPLPTRESFEERKRKQRKNENFVPSQDISQLLNKTSYANLLNTAKDQFLDIQNGSTLTKIKSRLNNYWLHFKRFALSKNTQLTLILGFVSILMISLIYFSIFSTEFIVKNYAVSFTNGSYLDKSSTQKVVQKFGDNGILGVIPYNHFWFLNSQTLTFVAKKVDPSITKVDLIGRFWPNNAQIKITTEPILSTLNINSEYYLISRSGKVIGIDYGGNRQKVVIVRSSHKNVDSQELGKVFSEIRPDSKAGNNQLNRLYFIENAINKLKENKINIVRTEIQTVFEKDTDVVFYTENGTSLIFDSQNISLGDNLNRLNVLLYTTKIGEDFNSGKLNYVDLRIKDKAYYCYQNSECKK